MRTISSALDIVRAIKGEIESSFCPPEETVRPGKEPIISHALVRRTRHYIEQVTFQVNGTYLAGCYDACAVMIRRLVEMLLIEVYEHHRLADKIKNGSGDFCNLSDMVDLTISESTWNLGRTTRVALPKLKRIGNLAAHTRRYIAHRHDIDNVSADLRVVVQELLILAGFRD